MQKETCSSSSSSNGCRFLHLKKTLLITWVFPFLRQASDDPNKLWYHYLEELQRQSPFLPPVGRPGALLAHQNHPFPEERQDGRNLANQLRLVVYPIVYRVSKNIPGGCLGFLPPTVWLALAHYECIIYMYQYRYDIPRLFHNTPNWNTPQATFTKRLIQEFLSWLEGLPGVCSTGVLQFSWSCGCKCWEYYVYVKVHLNDIYIFCKNSTNHI